MGFLGLEKPVEYTGFLIFDPTTAKMVLDAQDRYFNAVYADYQQGLEDMKEFKKEYGDFMTPILADLEWYNNNVTGRVRNFINDAYARGIDLTRSAEGRAALALMINSVDVGKIALLRTSAENAKEFLKARKQLEAQGLYNPLLAKYDGPDMSTYNTLNQGIWDKMSPTPYQNMATFGNPYFEGMKPNVRRESKNGVEYSVESITADDLMNIANNHFNELVSTPQGSLMYKYYLDQADGNAEAARMMFNSAVAAGQQRRIYEKSDYDDKWIEHQKLNLGWAKIQQDRDQFEWEKKYYEGLINSGDGSKNTSGGTNSSPDQGTASMVSYDLNKQYNQEKEDFYNKLKLNEYKLFNNLSGSEEKNVKNSRGENVTVFHGEKALANKYKKALKTYKDSKSTDSLKQEAKKVLDNIRSTKSENLLAWIKAYDNDYAWERYNSSISDETQWGMTQSESALMNKAHDVFYRNNVLSNPLSIGARSDMNTSLGIVEDPDGNKIGKVTLGTEFAPISEASFTGNRLYKYNSRISRLNRILRGKKYSVTAETEAGREYGSGEINNTKYNFVVQNVLFKDPAVIAELDKWDEKLLKEAGIERVDDNTYEVPIITKFSRGSQTWAEVNTETDKRVGGNTEAVRNRATRQAGSVIPKIK